MTKTVLAALAVACLFAGAPARAADLTATPATLASMLTATAATQGGDVITLAPGVYKPYVKGGGRVFSPSVVIQCGPGVVFQNYTPWSDIGGVTFKGCAFEDAAGSVILSFNRTSAIRVEGGSFTGVGVGVGKGSGLSVGASSEVTVDGATFHDLRGGISFGTVTNLTVKNSRFTRIASDGVLGSNFDGLTVVDNVFTDFWPLATVHPDAIQAWATTGFTNRNLVVERNEISRGVGKGWGQGIFMQQGSGDGYENVSIRDNLVLGFSWNSLRLCGGKGDVRVENNVLRAIKDDLNYSARLITCGVMPAGSFKGNVANAYVNDPTAYKPSMTENSIAPQVLPEEYAAVLLAWQTRNDAPADPVAAELVRLRAALAAANDNVAALQADLTAAKAREAAIAAERDALAAKIRAAVAALAS